MGYFCKKHYGLYIWTFLARKGCKKCDKFPPNKQIFDVFVSFYQSRLCRDRPGEKTFTDRRAEIILFDFYD